MGHVHRQVDKDVYPVVADHPGDLLMAQTESAPPGVGTRAQSFRDAIGTRHAGIAEDLEFRVVMGGEKRHGEECLTMLAKVRRDIPDPQSAVSRAIVGVRLNGPSRGFRELPIPAAVLFVDGLGIISGAEMEGVDEVAVRLGKVRLQCQCPAEAGDCLVELALDLEGSSQVIVCHKVIRHQFQCPAVTSDCFIRLSLVLEQVA